MLQTLTYHLSWDGADWRQSPFKWDDSLNDSKENMVKETKSFSYENLCPTDWLITRQIEEGIDVPTNVSTWRQSIREACRQKVQAIQDCLTKEDLNSYTTSAIYLTWPDMP